MPIDEIAKWPPAFTVLDHTEWNKEGDVLLQFAFDEWMCRRVGQGHMPLVRIWRHRRALAVGLRDYRLRNAKRAIERFRQDGYSVAVRNSGGAAVPLDGGVVNLSVIVPNPGGRMEHRGDFEMMAGLIQETVEGLSIGVYKGEVAGSYCPGDYDLSAGGRKFCGISQRRQTKALIIQAFVNVEGSGKMLAESARRFYREAADESSDNGYPVVEPEMMTSLAEIKADVSIAAFNRKLIETLERKGGQLEPFVMSDEALHPELRLTMEELKTRYEK